MAKAEIKTKTVEVVTHQTKEVGITLHLSMREAAVIRMLCGNIYGEGEFRSITDKIYLVLPDVDRYLPDVKYENNEIDKYLKTLPDNLE